MDSCRLPEELIFDIVRRVDVKQLLTENFFLVSKRFYKIVTAAIGAFLCQPPINNIMLKFCLNNTVKTVNVAACELKWLRALLRHALHVEHFVGISIHEGASCDIINRDYMRMEEIVHILSHILKSAVFLTKSSTPPEKSVTF